MKFLKFNISEAYNEVLYSFQGGGSTSEKITSTARLLGKSAANVGMFATEATVDMLKNLPESMGEKAQSMLDKNAPTLTEEQRERLQKQVEVGKEAKAKRLAREREEREQERQRELENRGDD